MQRAAILFSSFGPYHVARIEALGQGLKEAGHELTAFRFSEGSETYGWIPVLPEGVPTVTLALKPPSGAGDAWRLSRAFHRELKARKIGAVFLPTYSPLPNLLCVLAAKAAGCRTILMTESWFGTEDAGPLIKLVKHVLVRMFDSALVGGTPQRDYVAAYGMPREKIFTGYDVVDVAHFAAQADKVRSMEHGAWSMEGGTRPEGGTGGAAADRSLRRPNLNRSGVEIAEGKPEVGQTDALMRSLPERFFLNLGRFAEKKNLSTLVEAYARFVRARGEKHGAGSMEHGERSASSRNDYGVTRGEAADSGDPHAGGQVAAATTKTRHMTLVTGHTPASLVLVGEGPLRGDLERQARKLGLAVRNGLLEPNPSGGAEVVFYPFQQADVTPLFFSLCEAFVLPSTREEWGLVVNEAMACGAPVIVSRNVGCAQDLVGDVDGDRSVTHPTGHTGNAPGTSDSINNTAGPEATTGGEDTAAVDTRYSPLVTPHSVEPSSTVGFTFDPQNVDELAELLGRFAADPALRACLGDAGRVRIQGWTPERFGREGLKAMQAADGLTGQTLTFPKH